MTTRRTQSLWATLALTVTLLLASPAIAQVTSQDAADYLTTTLNTPDTALAGIAALAGTVEDADLEPIFTALASSNRKDIRLFAITAIPAALGDRGDALLTDRLQNDPLMSIRAEALAQLIARDATTTDLLQTAITLDDEAIQLMAGTALVREGEVAFAIDALTKLTESSDPDLAANARLTLLDTGNKTQLAPLRAYVTDGDPSPLAIELLLRQIREQETTSAKPIVDDVLAMENAPAALTVQAHRTLVAISNDTTAPLAQTIRDTENPALKVMLFTVLADQPDALRYLEQFAQSTEPLIGDLARFELARLASDDDASEIITAIFNEETPLMTAYLFQRASQDIRDEHLNVAMYVPGLIAQIHAANPEANTMGIEHVQAAQAATMLSDIGTTDAMDALGDILSQRHNATVRAVAAGMLHSANPKVCDLMEPLLQSAYAELWTDAALVLGRFGDTQAQPNLERVIANPTRHGTLMATQASWYLIKLDPDSKSLATNVGERIE
jgi:HEAT repeat protein